MAIDSPIRMLGGQYTIHKFNETDRALRDLGFYCEQIVPSTALPTVLRQMAKTIPTSNFYKLAIVPAADVIVGEDMTNSSALYMQTEGRLV